MSLLVALSTGVAYVSSVVMMVLDIRTNSQIEMPDTDMQTYFDSCVFLTFFILAGKALEARAKLKVCCGSNVFLRDAHWLKDWRCYRYARRTSS
jgi:cation transport ATPase